MFPCHATLVIWMSDDPDPIWWSASHKKKQTLAWSLMSLSLLSVCLSVWQTVCPNWRWLKSWRGTGATFLFKVFGKWKFEVRSKREHHNFCVGLDLCQKHFCFFCNSFKIKKKLFWQIFWADTDRPEMLKKENWRMTSKSVKNQFKSQQDWSNRGQRNNPS